MGAIKSLQWWIRRERPVSGPGHWKVKPNLQKGSLTPAGPCGWFLVHRGHCHMEKGWRGCVGSFGKLWGDDVKFNRKTQMVFGFFFISVESFRYHHYLSLPGSVEPCRGVIVLSDCAELHSSGKMDGKGSWSSLNGGTMRAGVRKLDYCPPRPSFSRQFRWMKLLNKRSLLFIINLLSSQVFASAEKELRPWISFCARRVALYLHMNWKFTLFSFSSLINWSD